MDICTSLLSEGAKIAIYDPQVPAETITGMMGDDSSKQLRICSCCFQAIESADAVVLMTEEERFRTLDMSRVHEVMMKPAFVFDSRGVWNNRELRDIGFVAYRLGQAYLDKF